jgi:hypothetical protein
VSTALTPGRRRFIEILLVTFGLPSAYETATSNAFWWSSLVPSIWPWFLIPAGLVLLAVDLWLPALSQRVQPNTGGSRQLGAITVEGWHRAEPASGRYVITTAFKGKAARVLCATDEKAVPTAIAFEKPRKTDYFRARDLPKKMRWRRGLHRHSIEVTKLVPARAG